MKPIRTLKNYYGKKWNNKYIYLPYQMTELHVFQTQPSLIRSAYNNNNKIMQWCAIL